MFRKKLCEGTQLGRRRSITWLATLDFGECFHILSSFSTPSTFGTKKYKRLIINEYYFLVSFWHTDCDYE